MKRILILGRSGSGKSTLANKLGTKLGIPVFHLDKLYWLPNWVERPKSEMAIDIEDILTSNESWIIDGNYRRAAFESRVQAADHIIVVDFGFLRSVLRALMRVVTHWNKVRPDMQDDCVERFNFDFIKYIWSYPSRSPERILINFPEKNILRFSNQKSLDSWFENIKLP